MITYDQHREFLEHVAEGAQAELMGFRHAQEYDHAPMYSGRKLLQARYELGFRDGKAKMLQDELAKPLLESGRVA